MWGGGGGALQFHTFSLLFFNLETSSVLAWLDWLNLFQVFSEGDSLSFTRSEICLALKQIFFFKVWGVFILFICFLEIIACAQNKGKFQIGQVVLRDLVSNRSGVLMGCFENMLSLETLLRPVCASPSTPPAQFQVGLDNSPPFRGVGGTPSSQGGVLGACGLPTAELTISALSAWKLLSASCSLVQSHQRYSLPCYLQLKMALSQRLGHTRSPWVSIHLPVASAQ